MIYHFFKPLYPLLSMVKPGIGGIIYSSNRFIIVAGILICLLNSLNSFAADITSTQTGNWNVGTTWIGGVAPVAGDNATIANGDTVTVTADATINLLTIDNGGVLTVNATKSLTANGDLTINGGLILKSDATGTATLIDNGTISGSGTVTAQRYLSGAVYHYVSAPISSANTSLFSGAHRFYLWDEPISSNDTVASWQTPAGNMDTMKGYAVEFLGNTVINYTGVATELNTGPYNITVTNTDGIMLPNKEGWNLVGNPYPSAVDWDDAGWTITNVDNAIYFFKGSDFNYASYVGGAGINGGTQYIPAMQGFFVKCNNVGGSGTLEITNSVRVINSQAYWKENKTEQNNILKLKAEGNGYSDETVVRFDASSTNEFDSDYDAYKLLSSNENVPQIYTKLSNGTILSINTLAPLTENLSMPLIFRAGVTGKYTLNVADINFDPSISVLLEDTQEDVIMDLQTTPDYTFNISTGTFANRFIIHFSLTTGVNDYSEDNNLSPYIYSEQNNIYVVFNTSKSIKGKITVYDILGREIIKKDIDKLNKLSINNVKGLYIVKVLTDNNVYTKKIIINK